MHMVSLLDNPSVPSIVRPRHGPYKPPADQSNRPSALRETINLRDRLTSSAMSDLGVVEETMTEVRRNWNVMLQDQVDSIAMNMLTV